jgi:Protein of unknown function (DUF1592)/Protein of unknown function (DUF1588)/Protein of unknown function (DUF1587)/Protein of unknown function (DUF1595)/Protein of unknown function (DUF1585)
MRGQNIARLLIGTLLLHCVAFSQTPPRTSSQPTASSTSTPSFDSTVLLFVTKNCYECHNATRKAGGMDLMLLRTPDSIALHRATWENVVRKVSSGEMPPESAPQPDEAELQAAMGWLKGEFARLDSLVVPAAGRVTARRLNRTEYNNTVRDLLGVDSNPAGAFPQDDSGYGFDNIGDVLSLSPVLLEKYLTAAERVARAAIFGPEKLKPTLVRYQPPYRKKSDGDVIRFGGPQNYTLLDYDVTGLATPMSIHLTHRFPVDGEYLFRVTPEGRRPGGSEPVKVALWIEGKVAKVIEIDATDLEGQTREFRLKVAAGERWLAVSFLRQFEGLPAKYGALNPSKRPAPPPEPPPKPRANATAKEVEEFQKRIEARKNRVEPADGFRINFLEIGGPYDYAQGPSNKSLQKIYSCGHLNGQHKPGCARKIVADLARRAYRRPVTADEVAPLVRLISLARQHGDSFEEGLSLAVQAILVSPHFLFRIEKDRPAIVHAAHPVFTSDESAHPLSQHELASRLSYFLWSSMPDDELFHCADQQLLRKPAVLAAQVRRMLQDPKSRALVENFGGQWLELRRLESATPDRDRFPDFDEYLRMSMRQETEMFFTNIVREDRSILDFIDGSYSFVNERLAQLYHLSGVVGPEFRRVDLTGNRQRGGVLTQASVLTVSSYATRTSPVLRGQWILGNLLNAAAPPPPPNVPNLNEAAIGTAASLRQQMEQHRKNATCASCHARMDPLGFGLENYDAIGAWRTEDGKFPVDPAGVLPDGRTFKEPCELKALLKVDRDAFAQGLTEKLLTYALGRGLESYDKPAVKKIAGSLAHDDYRFSSLVLNIVSSVPFQLRGERSNES